MDRIAAFDPLTDGLSLGQLRGLTGGLRRMRLAKVTISGFKSFADSTEFRFDLPNAKKNIKVISDNGRHH